MHKNKDGKVTASLTEVKNRTGDIFALVDEFGEVYLTSYNKLRYKITKTDIANFIELGDSPTKTEKKVAKKPEVKVVEEKKVEAKKEEPKEVKENTVLNKISKILPWDRNNSAETNFANQSRSPLVSN